MKEFIKSLFSDVNGSISSKRTILFALLLTFLLVCIMNLFYGKSLSATLHDQLFYLIIYALAAVFGEPAINAVMKPKSTALGGGTGPGGERPKDPPINP